MSQVETVDNSNIPQHVAIIMDGNGRWAKKQGAMRVFGHNSAINAVREAAEGAAEMGIKYLTLYAFSTENWGRPKAEVDALMELLVSTIRKETKTLMKNNIRLKTIGHTEGLPAKCQRELKEAMDITAENNRLDLILALNYSGRWEIVEATKKIAADVQLGKIEPSDITDQVFESYLTTAGIPDPELLIRTSGEMRVSNYLLWQIAYTEIFITEVLWPDFNKALLTEAVKAYQSRERRFGKVLES